MTNKLDYFYSLNNAVGLYLVEEGVGDSQYDSGQGRAVTGGHLLEVRVVDGVEGTIIRHKP